MQISTKLQRFSSSVKVYNNFYNGQYVPSSSTQHYEVYNPVTQQHIARAPQSSHEEFNAAVASAK
jgi:acyl-CoA reductase-like NAD-dependent aldehyde dehydrogenase